VSLPALAHRYPSSRSSVRRQSWPCRFNSLGIWVVGLDPHPTPGPFCDGPELCHGRTDIVNLYISLCLSLAPRSLPLSVRPSLEQALWQNPPVIQSYIRPHPSHFLLSLSPYLPPSMCLFCLFVSQV